VGGASPIGYIYVTYMVFDSSSKIKIASATKNFVIVFVDEKNADG